MTVGAVTVEGPADILEGLRPRLLALGVLVSETTLLDGGGDALDAPFSGKKFVAALGIVTAVLNTGTAGLKFATEVEAFIKDHPGITLVVHDALSQEPLALVTSASAQGALASALAGGE